MADPWESVERRMYEQHAEESGDAEMFAPGALRLACQRIAKLEEGMREIRAFRAEDVLDEAQEVAKEALDDD